MRRTVIKGIWEEKHLFPYLLADIMSGDIPGIDISQRLYELNRVLKICEEEEYYEFCILIKDAINSLDHENTI